MFSKLSAIVFYAAAIYFIVAKLFQYIYRTHHLLGIKSLTRHTISQWYATLIFVDPSDVCADDDRKLSWCSGAIRSFKFDKIYLFRQTMRHDIEDRLSLQLIKHNVNLTGLDIEVIIGTKHELQPYSKKDLDSISCTGCPVANVEHAIRLFNQLPAIL